MEQIDFKMIKRLAELLNMEGLKHIEYFDGTNSIKIDRNDGPVVPRPEKPEPKPRAPKKAVEPAPKPVKEAAVPVVAPKEKIYEIRSPIEGIYMACPEEGAPHFVNVGQNVGTGDVLCYLDDGELNEIESDLYGEVVAILVEDGAQVAVDQVILKIKGK